MNFPANGVIVLIDPIVCVFLFIYLNYYLWIRSQADSRIQGETGISTVNWFWVLYLYAKMWYGWIIWWCKLVHTMETSVETIVNQCSLFLPGSSIAFIVRHWAFFSLLVGHWYFFGDHLFSLISYLLTWVFTLWLILGVLYIL